MDRGETLEAFEQAVKERESQNVLYTLRLYIAGSTPNSIRAVKNIRDICNRYLHGRCDLEVIDLYQQPALARQDRVIAIPTLVRKKPGADRRVIGDLSDSAHVLKKLEIATT